METAMRTSRDRIRHTLMFEFFLVMLCVPLLSALLGQPMHTMGALSLSLSLIAMTLNYLYNLVFDQVLARLGRPVYTRGFVLRAVHALLFELVLLFVSVPMIMFMLEYSLMQALLLDLGFVVMVPVYGFVFNVIYDRVFPPPAAVCAVSDRGCRPRNS